MRPAVAVESVSKKYVLRHERFRSFQQVTIDFLTRRRRHDEEFWALRDIDFTVEPGETFGIVGANGSGKSTLLKLIARVIRPTSGRITTSGRVAALIELGAGFHPDLTGRENVFLHGSFLGFSRRQMRERYGSIVEFAEVEPFMDTPLKHYSSGMMMRLGFATAIAVDANVLIVDEVLAVGDIRFQRKCLDALQAFRRNGGTILLVAHDIGIVRRFCDRALLLSHGRAIACGKPADVIGEYVYGDVNDPRPIGPVETLADPAGQTNQAAPAAIADLRGPAQAAPEPPGAEIVAVRVLNAVGQPVNTVLSGDPIRIEIDYQLRRSFDRIIPGIQFISDQEEYLYGVAADDLATPATPGRHQVRIELPTGPFVGGRVLICVGLADHVSEAGYHQVAYRNRQDSFQVLPVSREEGLIRFPTVWSVADDLPEPPPQVAPDIAVR